MVDACREIANANEEEERKQRQQSLLSTHGGWSHHNFKRALQYRGSMLLNPEYEAEPLCGEEGGTPLVVRCSGQRRWHQRYERVESLISWLLNG